MERMMKDSHSHSLVQAITATRHNDVMHLVMSVFVLLDCDYFLLRWFRGSRNEEELARMVSTRNSQAHRSRLCTLGPPFSNDFVPTL